MGGSVFSHDFYAERARVRADTGAPVFVHDAAVRSGKASALHPALDPSKLKNGVREARDSDTHPNSVPILFMLDVTGSMSRVPSIVQDNLGKLMTTLLTGGVIADPQILFGAIGDVTCDQVGLQVGQFEAGNEMEDDLTRVYLEAGGGGQNTESYELAFYFAARHTASDAWDKRHRKGYLFITGDEHPYPTATPQAIHKVFGGEFRDGAIPTEQLVKECQERYNVFFLIPGGSGHGNSPELHREWARLLGEEHVVQMPDPAKVCDVVSNIIGTVEGTVTKLPTVSATTAAAAPDPTTAAATAAVDKAKAAGGKTARL